MVNMQGIKDLVGAVGGVTLNVRQPIPVGGLGNAVTAYIPPGVRQLNGFNTLWYARSREGSDDYSRMARQKCVMNAMLNQISPQVAVRNFEKIAKASSAMISTDVPASEVDRFMQLALEAKGRQAIAKAEGHAARPGKAKKPSNDVVTGGSVGSLHEGYAANQADDLESAC